MFYKLGKKRGNSICSDLLRSKSYHGCFSNVRNALETFYRQDNITEQTNHRKSNGVPLFAGAKKFVSLLLQQFGIQINNFIAQSKTHLHATK